LNWYSCDTTLDLIEFIRLYDLHGTIFSVAYLRNLENAMDKRYVGELQLEWYKALAGLLSFLGLWLIIWGPLFIFSGASPFLTQNPISFASLDIYVANSVTEFQIYSQRSYNVRPMTSDMMNPSGMNRNILSLNKPNQQNQYVTFLNTSNSNYAVPRGLFKDSREGGLFNRIRYVWQISRQYPPGFEDILLKSAQVLNSTAQQSLESAMDSSRRSSTSERSKHPFNLGEVFQDSISCGRKECLLNTNYMHTLQGSIVNSNDGTVFYILNIDCPANDYDLVVENIVTSSGVATGIFADDSFSLGGLYITVVFVVGNILRSAMKGISQKIIFTEMEDVSVPVFLCSSIIKARRVENYYVEHQLYLHLIQLFRRPDQLYELTTKSKSVDTMTEPRLNGPWLNANLSKDSGHPNFREWNESKAKLDKLD